MKAGRSWRLLCLSLATVLLALTGVECPHLLYHSG